MEPDICYCAYHGREWWWSTNRVCFAPRQVVRGALGVLTTIIRTYCTCTLGDRCATARYGIGIMPKRSGNSHSCRAGARRPNLSAHRQQGHPIDGNGIRPGPAGDNHGSWMRDAMHYAHAGRQDAFRSCTECMRSLAKPGGLLRVLTCQPPTEKQQQRQPTRHMFMFSLRHVQFGPWLSEF